MKSLTSWLVFGAVGLIGAAWFAGCGTSTPATGDAGTTCGTATLCGTTCADLPTDNANCGACGTVCAAGQVCSKGACATSCGGGTTLCGTTCNDTQTDANNCGACGTKCVGGQVCSAGKCTATCASSEMLCGSSCVNTQTDNANCGTCGTICGAGMSCTGGGCGLTCQTGLTLCTGPTLPDGGLGDASTDGETEAATDAATDAAAIDSGVVLAYPYCANFSTDNANCGGCGITCPAWQACVASACINAVSGAGTALSPWTFATPPANCKAYYTDLVDAADGVYTTDPSGTNINVYCDMKDGGVTYQDFGFGDYSKTYAGYTFIGAPDFALPEVDAAFAYLYTRNVGLTNLDTSWHSTNCCIMNTTTTNWYTFGTTNVYMYPGNGSTVECNPATYSWSVVTLFLENTNTELTSITAAQASVVTVDSGCSTGNNPAIFVERY